MRRSLGRRLRSRRPHAGPGRHRHAGPREFDGRIGQAFPALFPGRHHEAGRRLHHQRPVDGHRPSQRLRHHHAMLPERQAGGAVLLHQPSHGYRRHRLRARRHRRVHGGPLYPDAEAVRPGPGERDPDGDDPHQHPAAGRHRGRRLLAGRLQRRGRPPPGRDDGRIRHRYARRPRRSHHRPLARGRAGRDRQAAQGHLAQCHDGRRLRRAGDA